MRSRTVAFILTCFSVAAAACSGSSSGPPGPNNPAGTAMMRARIDGTQWIATTGAAARNNNVFTITGIRTGSPATTIVLVLHSVAGPGVYPFRPASGINGWASLQTGANTTLIDFEQTNPGQVTLTSITATRVAGTFAFVGKTETSGAIVSVTNGEFDVPLETH